MHAPVARVPKGPFRATFRRDTAAVLLPHLGPAALTRFHPAAARRGRGGPEAHPAGTRRPSGAASQPARCSGWGGDPHPGRAQKPCEHAVLVRTQSAKSPQDGESRQQLIS
jgi:hypothetical protein